MKSLFCCFLSAWFGLGLSFGDEGLARSESVSRIAFGSCLRQDLPAPIWEAVAVAQPEVWIWLGDNIYGDTADAEKLAMAYGKVKASPGYANLRGSSLVMGTWDDHDYGKNNGGKEWQGKGIAQKALLDFLDEPANSPRRQQEGIYWSHIFGAGDRMLRVVLLDGRYHRDSPDDPDGDIFGAEQRAWIEALFENDEAAITLVASGTQVISEDHGYEKWAQFPKSRAWFFDLVKRKAKGRVVFLSGDRHIAEISMEQPEGHRWSLVDITSSSLTHSWGGFPGEANRHRVGKVFTQNNFGLLEIDWEARELRATLRGIDGEIGLEQMLAF